MFTLAFMIYVGSESIQLPGDKLLFVENRLIYSLAEIHTGDTLVVFL
jgi:hypothetical protein